MKIKKYNEFVNEEISMKGIATGILAKSNDKDKDE